jgi:hypothetical protein
MRLFLRLFSPAVGGPLFASERFRVKHALGLGPGVDTGSREETRQNEKLERRF